MNKSWQVFALCAVLCVVQTGQAGRVVQTSQAGLTLFSSGYSLPETITPVPAGFGAYGGGYFVDDLGGTAGNSTTWYVPSTGGAPTAVATSQGLSTDQSFWRGGTFLPNNFGSIGGQYLITTGAGLTTMNSNGQLTPFINTASSGYSGLTTPVLAPSSFGNFGGQLFVTAQTGPTAGVGGVLAVNPNGSFTNFVSLPDTPFGLAFAPSKFGAIGGDMLVADGGTGKLYAVNAAGQSSLFATLPFFSPGGLRQMAFAGSDFGRFSNDLLVSISASNFGGGQLGSVVALNGAGDIVGVLELGTQINAFDPRGITFIGNGQVLISDASDPIYVAAVADFKVVPEPATLVSCFIGAGALFGYRRFRRPAVQL
jgi:hypothetical protein